MKITNRLSIVEKTHDRLHRSHIIIHSIKGCWTLAEFDTVAQLDFFCGTLGISYTANGWHDSPELGIYREYLLSHTLEDAMFRYTTDGLPAGAKPIRALSNGSIVTCYYYNDGETVTIYRPNPNDKAIYQPLSIEDHIAHRRIYGLY